MVEKEIAITETAGVERTGEYVRVGIPFAKGEFDPLGGTCIVTPEGRNMPAQSAVLARWQDGSVKWLLVDFAVSAAPLTTSVYRLRCGCTVQPTAPVIRITPGPATWEIDTGGTLFSVDAQTLRPFAAVTSEAGEILAPMGRCSLLLREGAEEAEPLVESIVTEHEGPLRATLRLEGCFPPRNDHAPRFVCRIDFFAGSSAVRIEFSLRNPSPARHPGGLWDLGDPGSLLFRDLTFTFPFPADAATVVCVPEPGGEAVTASPGSRLSLYQESSGGKNWSHPVHRAGDGKVPLTFRGYRLNGRCRQRQGLRATPLLWCGNGTSGTEVSIPRFWQEFPKALEADERDIRVSLFPHRFPVLHELQGGEWKTSLFHADFAARPGGLAWTRCPLSAVASPAVVRHSGAIRELSLGALPEPEVVDRFIAGGEVFLAKREAADEFGWRNFGDVPADHEAVYQASPERFVSHYCNQYDLCAGMYRKFLSGGGTLWGELAADLARHVVDIDIYHTDRDREEYNGGLFWHTDHYVDAGLSTHRSFSREHLAAKDPRFCGGGPGFEHCYTTGLMLHYFLTGEPDYRDAVIGLAEWSYRLLAGPHPVLAVLKKGKRSLDLLRSTAGEIRPYPRFPLTRGTGNTINACLDAFAVGGGRNYLARGEELIRGALHPGDDIGARDLLNAEVAWSYNVLLVSVAKFLDTKEEQEEYDEGYHYAREALLAYGEWMLAHEYPYLEKPEILEYPNETWPAQDLRKSVVLYHAARHAAPERREAFLHRARFFLTAACTELERHRTTTFTRPLALMLQNGWVARALAGDLPSRQEFRAGPCHFGPPTPSLGISSACRRIGSDLCRSLRETSVRREMAWLRARLGSGK